MKPIKIFCLAVTVLMLHQLNAQVISFSPVSGFPAKFTVGFNLGTAAPASDFFPTHISTYSSSSAYSPSVSSPATSTFLEFGDGNFTRSENEVHDYAGSTYPILAKLTSVYDEDPRPPRHRPVARPTAVATTVSSPGNTALTMPTILATGKSVAISSNVYSILANDTMIFVVTYKLAGKENQKLPPHIIFSYNNVNAFNVISITGSVNQSSLTIPLVRPHFGETVSNLSSSASGFSNSIKIAGLDTDGAEHHVFITLAPLANLSKESVSPSFASIDAPDVTADVAVQLYNGSNTPMQSDVLKLPIMDKSHDPNFVEIFPKCLLLPKKAGELKFHVRCQNIGFGKAKKVVMKVGLPGGMKPSDIIVASTKDEAPHGVKGVWDFSDPDSLIVRFDLTSFSAGSSSFTLEGIAGSNDYMNDKNTMAEIWFNIKTNNLVPNLLVSAASIYFTNEDHTVNPAVRTDFDFAQYRECCDCKPDKNRCDKNKKRCKLWRWLFCKKC